MVLYALTETQLIQIRALHNRKNDNISSNKLLRILSIYYNKGWKKTYYNAGYFINKNPLKEEWTTVEHKSVCYPGIAYFKDVNDDFSDYEIKNVIYDETGKTLTINNATYDSGTSTITIPDNSMTYNENNKTIINN